MRQLRAVAVLPGGARLVCGYHAMRFDSGDDWLVFFMPPAALGDVEPRVGGYPFGGEGGSLAWRAPLDEWLASLGQIVMRTSPFRVGLIGFETEEPELAAIAAGDPIPGLPSPYCAFLDVRGTEAIYVPAVPAADAR
jgi:hypothetical protein